MILSLSGLSALVMLWGVASRASRRDTRGHRWPLLAAHGATLLAVGLLLVATELELLRAIGGLSHATPQLLDWLAWGAATVAVVVSLWDRKAEFTLAGLYCLGVIAISLGELERDAASGKLFAWSILCEWTAIVLIAALAGWWTRRSPQISRLLRLPNDRTFWPDTWFSIAQATLAIATAFATGWIALDFSFDDMGQDVALFGLAGRQATCSAALMLVGATILMAWQSGGCWRAGWQYAAMTAGVLFTSSLGWMRLEDPASGGEPLWLASSTNLTVSAAMMTLLTRFGLARFLPRSGDWITRGRQAAPFFGCLALLTLLVVITGIACR